MKTKITALILVLVAIFTFASCGSQSQTDSEKITASGKLVIGITDYAPMDYKDENGEWTGFDAEYAKLFATSLGLEAEFIEIDWDSKIFELNSGAIDCIWNGMTITDEVLLNTSCSNPYINNSQVVVMKADAAANYNGVDSLKNLSFAVEGGSAGMAAAQENGYKFTEVPYQTDALLEVKSGSSDACIIDETMAKAMTGEGTSYAELTVVATLTEEKYGVAFRKDSDMTEKLNDFFKANKATIAELANKYDLTIAD